MEDVSLAYWAPALMLAKAAGIAAVSRAHAAGDRGPAAHRAAKVLGAGAIEGLLLGTAQAIGLRALGARG